MRNPKDQRIGKQLPGFTPPGDFQCEQCESEIFADLVINAGGRIDRYANVNDGSRNQHNVAMRHIVGLAIRQANTKRNFSFNLRALGIIMLRSLLIFFRQRLGQILLVLQARGVDVVFIVVAMIVIQRRNIPKPLDDGRQML